MLDETDESEELGGERKERRRKDSGGSDQPEEEVTALKMCSCLANCTILKHQQILLSSLAWQIVQY